MIRMFYDVFDVSEGQEEITIVKYMNVLDRVSKKKKVFKIQLAIKLNYFLHVN